MEQNNNKREKDSGPKESGVGNSARNSQDQAAVFLTLHDSRRERSVKL